MGHRLQHERPVLEYGQREQVHLLQNGHVSRLADSHALQPAQSQPTEQLTKFRFIQPDSE